MRRTQMREPCFLTRGEDCGHPIRQLRRGCPAHAINAAVLTDQMSRTQPPVNHAVAEPFVEQLPPCYHAVLTAANRVDDPIRRHSCMKPTPSVGPMHEW